MYATLAEVYDWLVPEQQLTPEGSAKAFEDVVAGLPAGARVLDCACGTGTLAVGLALHGFEVVAADASPAMVGRARALVGEHGVNVPVHQTGWEELGDRGWSFDAVLCVGNSLTHAGPRPARRAALANMASVLEPGGLLAVTSRNWEQVRAGGSGVRIADRVTQRNGRTALVVHGWTIALGWDDAHALEVNIAIIDDQGEVSTHGERLSFWPFTHEALAADLAVTGLTQTHSTYAPEAERYLVIAHR